MTIHSIFQNAQDFNGERRWRKRETIPLSTLPTRLRRSFGLGLESFHGSHLLKDNQYWFPFLFIDLDSTDLNAARMSAKALAEYFLRSIPATEMQIFFSRSKGFHLLINSSVFVGDAFPNEESFGPKIQKQIVEQIERTVLGSYPVKPDYRVYGKGRVIRCANSIHIKTNLYKTPLSYAELELSIDEIQRLAAKPFRAVAHEMDECFTHFRGTVSIAPLSALFTSISSDITEQQAESYQRSLAPRTQKACLRSSSIP